MRYILLALMTAATLIAAPRAVVFDFGGVMVEEPNRELVVRFLCDSLQLSETEWEQANLEKRQAVKAGKTDEAFWLEFAKRRGISLGSNWWNDYEAIVKNLLTANPGMYTLVDQLKEKEIPVALLSNVKETWGKLIRKLGLYEPFDLCLLSYEIGVDKPDPKAYEFLLKELNLPAKEVVFVDDRLENIEAAKKVGLDAILFESEEQVREELRARELVVHLPSR